MLALWGHLTFDSEPTLRGVVTAGEVGLVLGALISTQVKMSRGGTLLIDLGGVLGIMGGGLVAAGANRNSATGLSLFIGTATGLAIATGVTRNWASHPVAIRPLASGVVLVL